MRWCLAEAGLRPAGPRRGRLLVRPGAGQARADDMGLSDPWDHLRMHVRRAGARLPRHRAARPRPRAGPVRARTTSRTPPRPASPPRRETGDPSACWCSTAAASAPPTSPAATSDGRAGGAGRPGPAALARPALRVAHRAPRASCARSDEYKVMALASYGTPRSPATSCARLIHADRRRRLRGAESPDWAACAPAARADERTWAAEHADLAASVQQRLEEVLRRARPLAARAHRRPDPDHGRRHGAELRCQHPHLAREPVRARCGCSRPPATPARRWAPRCSCRADGWASRLQPMSDGRARARLDATTSSRPGCDAPTCRSPRRTTSPTRSPTCSPTTASSPGSRAAASSGRGRSDTARCWPTRAGPRTSSGSTTSRAASSSGRWRRWCWLDRAPRDLLRRADARARTCCSCTRSRRSGATASRPWCTSTAPPASRPSTPATSPLVAALLRAFERRTGLPVVVNTSLNTAGRPMVDDPRDALELLRLGAGRPAGPRAASGAAWRHVRPGAPDDGRPPTAVRRRGPDRRPAQPGRGCSAGSPRRRTGAREVVVVDDRPGDVEPLTARADLGAAAARQGAPGRRPRPGRGPQRRLAGHDGAVGRLPRRRRRAAAPTGARDLAADLAALRRRRGGVARADCACRCRPTAGPPTGSATRPACGRARWITADMAYRRAALRGRATASTSASPGPTGRTPTWRCGCSEAGWRLQVGAAHDHAPGPAGRPLGQRAGAARQRRRRADAPAARPGLAATRADDRPRPAPPAPGHRRRRLAAVAGLAASPASGGRPARGSPRPAPWPGWPTAEFAWRRIAPARGPRRGRHACS